MYTALKNIAADNEWFFKYARKDYANLVNEMEDNQTYLFLDPVQTSTNFDEYGEADGTTYTGSFMLLKSSDFDGDYEEKYLSNIKPLIDSQLKTVKEAFLCTAYSIDSWSTTEVINLFDMNLDGVVVRYSVSI